jgi:hypothetical protein
VSGDGGHLYAVGFARTVDEPSGSESWRVFRYRVGVDEAEDVTTVVSCPTREATFAAARLIAGKQWWES